MLFWTHCPFLEILISHAVFFNMFWLRKLARAVANAQATVPTTWASQEFLSPQSVEVGKLNFLDVGRERERRVREEGRERKSVSKSEDTHSRVYKRTSGPYHSLLSLFVLVVLQQKSSQRLPDAVARQCWTVRTPPRRAAVPTPNPSRSSNFRRHTASLGPRLTLDHIN